MKKWIMLIVMSVHLFAVSALSTMGSSEKELFENILKELKLESVSEAKKAEIYDSISFALEKDWYAKWNSEDTLSSSKVANADTEFEQKVDKNNYAYYAKKGYVSDQAVYVEGSSGMVMYKSMSVVNF